MATNFPGSLDNSTTIPAEAANIPLATNHVIAHQNIQDAIEAIEAKVGVNTSAVTTTHDYKLSLITGSDKAASLTGTETLTNKVLGTGTKITLGSDATGDIYYRHSDGTAKRRAIGTSNQVLSVNAGVPEWRDETPVVNASTTVAGIVEEATLAEIDANTATGGTGARLFINPSTLGKSVDGTLASNSDAKIPSEKAVKTYVDAKTLNSAHSGSKAFVISGTNTMAGIGYLFTPTKTGNVFVTFPGYATYTAAVTHTVTIRYGTGTAPAVDAASTGSQIGIAIKFAIISTLSDVAFCCSGYVSGLTPGTQYWFDVVKTSSGGGNNAIASFTIIEV